MSSRLRCTAQSRSSAGITQYAANNARASLAVAEIGCKKSPSHPCSAMAARLPVLFEDIAIAATRIRGGCAARSPTRTGSASLRKAASEATVPVYWQFHEVREMR